MSATGRGGAAQYDDYDDDDDSPPEPWEVGIDEQCSCELCLVHCDASDPWCDRHGEYAEASAWWNARSAPTRADAEGDQPQ